MIKNFQQSTVETLNTLKYANRARNIKNKIQINQDQSSRTISTLRREIAALQLELLEYKQGKRSVDEEGNPAISDTSLENAMLLADNKRLQQRLKAMQETINTLTERNTELLAQQAVAGWSGNESDQSVTEMIANYIAEIEKLKAKLIESEQMFLQIKKSQSVPPRNALKQNSYLDGKVLYIIIFLAGFRFLKLRFQEKVSVNVCEKLTILKNVTSEIKSQFNAV
jgi:kinesin family member 21